MNMHKTVHPRPQQIHLCCCCVCQMCACMCTYACILVYVCMYACTHEHMYTRSIPGKPIMSMLLLASCTLCMHVRTYVCMCLCMHAHTSGHMPKYKNTYINTYFNMHRKNIKNIKKQNSAHCASGEATKHPFIHITFIHASQEH